MSQYRATKSNFLPPPRKHEILHSEQAYTDGQRMWLMDNDWHAKPDKYKNWALFDSDQWSKNWVIAYVTFVRENESNLPQIGETIVLTRGEDAYSMVVVNVFPTKRVCRTYVLQRAK